MVSSKSLVVAQAVTSGSGRRRLSAAPRRYDSPVGTRLLVPRMTGLLELEGAMADVEATHQTSLELIKQGR